MANGRDQGSYDRESGSLRGIAGSGPSRVGVVGAMRARDVSRPREADLAAALERDGSGPAARAAGTRRRPQERQGTDGEPGTSPVSS